MGGTRLRKSRQLDHLLPSLSTFEADPPPSSFLRWKQQDIHQKRAERQVRISKLKTEIALNGTLRPRIISLLTALSDLPPIQALSTFSNLVQQLRTSPSPDKPNTGAPNQPTYDIMLLHLLEQVTKEATEVKGPKIEGGDEEKMVARLEERLRHHNGLLDARTKECEVELEKEEKESKAKITSEGIHDGFDSGVSRLVLRFFLLLRADFRLCSDTSVRQPSYS